MEIASGVISKEQHAMFKGRSIDKAVKSVYDSFYKTLTEGKDVTLLQTDFCKAYDYVNHDALLHILKGLNTPPQVIYVVEKVLRESVTWLPNIGGSKRGGNNESIQSQTGVRQRCPISPLLFVIVFVSSGRVWWKKIAEKRKERCKLHSIARAGNMKKTKSLTYLFMNRFQAHI